jgi:hypothetical protein
LTHNQKQLAMREISLTFLEKYSDADSPMIGTISKPLSLVDFKARLLEMFLEHFDSEDIKLPTDIDERYEEMLTNQVKTEFTIEVVLFDGLDSEEQEIEMLRTWLF